jgi:DNA mismatch endonuclease (patch repair protein)
MAPIFWPRTIRRLYCDRPLASNAILCHNSGARRIPPAEVLPRQRGSKKNSEDASEYGDGLLDVLPAEQRSERMSRVRSKDTKPEMVVRRLVHSLGCRFRLHNRQLPGSPDLVFARLKTVIFVHGCFWHRHPRCKKASTPATNPDFWRGKFNANRLRDKRQIHQLRRLGWEALIVWECETRDPEKLKKRLCRELKRT